MDDDPGFPFDQFKGVMLSRRPDFQRSIHMQLNPPKRFVPSGRSKVGVGYGPSQEELLARYTRQELVRQRKSTTLRDHRKWLKDLQEMKKNVQHEEEMAEREKLEKDSKFAERQAKLRKVFLEKGKEGGVSALASKEVLEDVPAETSSRIDMSAPAPLRRKTKKKKRSSRPAWSMTKEQFESEAVDVEQEDEEKEVDELLEFMKELDYDKFVDEFEVFEKIEEIDNKIRAIEVEEAAESGDVEPAEAEVEGEVEDRKILLVDEGEVKRDEGRGSIWMKEEKKEQLRKFSKERAAKMFRLKKQKRALEKMLSQMSQKQEEKDVENEQNIRMQEAKRLLKGSRELGRIHSTKSIMQVASSAQKKEEESEDDEMHLRVVNPRLAKHSHVTMRPGEEEQDGAPRGDRYLVDMRKDGKAPSLLPYLYRHPAV